MRILVRAKPGAKIEGVKEAGGRLTVSVKEKPVGGKAISEYFCVASFRVRIVSGHATREKTVEITGLASDRAPDARLI